MMEDAKVLHDYTHAIVARIPSNGRAHRDTELKIARIEHESLVRLIRELGLEVVEADTTSNDNNFPDSIFIEEYAIVWNGTALLTRPTTDEEAEKILALQNVLEKMMFKVRHVGALPAKLNMADVLFTGREFFVGISDTSNMEGACCIASTFPEYSCSLVKACHPRHLKHYISIAGPDVLCVVSNPIGKELLRKVEANATFNYKTVTVPEAEAANCLYLNGHLIHRAIEEIPESFKVFCEKIDFSRRSICFTEIAKHKKGLSSCCLLVKHPVI